MDACMIFNPNAGSADQAEALLHASQKYPSLRVCRTEHPRHASALAADAARGGCERLVVAGGDGTTNEVINGMAPDFRPIVGIIALGTGNDLPRTLALPDDPAAALDLAMTAEPRRLDLVKAHTASTSSFFINVAAGGFSGAVNEAMTDEMKARWGPLAFIRGAVSLAPDVTNYRTTIAFDDGSAQDSHLLNLIVANGRTAGGGLEVAPRADPEDGLLDVVAVHSGTALEVAGVVARLMAGDYTNSDIVSFRRAKRVHVSSTPGMWFNVDGELMTNDPITFTIYPRAIGVVCGPGYGKG